MPRYDGQRRAAQYYNSFNLEKVCFEIKLNNNNLISDNIDVVPPEESLGALHGVVELGVGVEG